MQPGSMQAPPPVQVLRERMPLSALLRVAIGVNFAKIDQLPAEEQRRAGLLGLVLGAAFSLAGFVIARLIVRVTGLGYNKWFLLGVGYGGMVAGIGAYRTGVSFFPSLRGEGRLASLARMLIVLVALCAIGALMLFAFLGG
jgi:hypothetical protein